MYISKCTLTLISPQSAAKTNIPFFFSISSCLAAIGLFNRCLASTTTDTGNPGNMIRSKIWQPNPWDLASEISTCFEGAHLSASVTWDNNLEEKKTQQTYQNIFSLQKLKLFSHKKGKHWEFTKLMAVISAAEKQDKWNIVWKRLNKCYMF